jgi:PII-like signaling protein
LSRLLQFIEVYALRQKMGDLTIRIKKNYEVGSKRLQTLIIDCLVKAGIEGATVLKGVNGFGKRGKSTLHLEGVLVNMPLIIEVVDKQEKLEALLPDLKMIVGGSGLLTIQETYAI